MGEILTSVEEAVAIVDRGGVVVVPTETVYGLACRPENVAKIAELKQRSVERSVQLLVPGAEWLTRVGRPNELALALADAFWPGPLTLVVHSSADAPRALVFDGTIGVRVPAHPIAMELLALCGPLAASSANETGKPTPSTVLEIRSIFGPRADGYLDGGEISGSGSTVIDATDDIPVLLREGPIMRSDVERVTKGRTSQARSRRGGFGGRGAPD